MMKVRSIFCNVFKFENKPNFWNFSEIILDLLNFLLNNKRKICKHIVIT